MCKQQVLAVKLCIQIYSIMLYLILNCVFGDLHQQINNPKILLKFNFYTNEGMRLLASATPHQSLHRILFPG